MEDNVKEGEETSTRRNEWEVVSLTASAYAAAPGPKEFESNDDDKGNDFADDNEETSRAMFMSGHFVFPPSQHENLPLEPNISEIENDPKGEGVGPDEVLGSDVEEGDRSDKTKENWTNKGLTSPDELPGILFFDEKGNSLSGCGKEFERGSGLQSLNLVDKEQSIYSDAKFSSFHTEADICGSTAGDEHTVLPEPGDPSQQCLDTLSDLSELPNRVIEDKYNESSLPCEAWWKRRAASLYAHAKEANSFWSIFVAAALMGLVILGQRLQQDRWQIHQLKRQFSINDEIINRMLGPISRFKDVIVGGHRRGSAIRGSAEH